MSDSRILDGYSGTHRFYLPEQFPPPRGVKLIVYTSGGVSIVSDWSDDSNHVAWYPLPKKPIRYDGEPELLTEEPDHG